MIATRSRSASLEEDIAFNNSVTAKGVAMAVLCLTSLTLGLLPIKLQKWFKWDKNPKGNKYVSMMLAFGGGVLLCTTFLHLLPEVTENIEELVAEEHISELPFHLSEFLMCTGFFIMYFVEECVHTYLDKRRKRNLVEQALVRTISIRRSKNLNPSAQSSTNSVSTNTESPTVTEGHERHESSHQDLEHGHSHGNILEDNIVSSLRGLLIVLALSIHELFEGLAVGLEASASNVWYMFGAVAAHKLVIAFCIGVELVTNKTKTTLTIIYVAIFAIVSPLGIGIGIGLSEGSTENMEVVSVFLQGLASGTLLYVVFFEILDRDKTGGLKNYIVIVFGFLVMFALSFVCKY